MTASQRLDEITSELRQIDRDLPGVLRALGNSIPIKSCVEIRTAIDGIHATANEEYEKRFPPTPRYETRGEKLVSERDR